MLFRFRKARSDDEKRGDRLATEKAGDAPPAFSMPIFGAECRAMADVKRIDLAEQPDSRWVPLLSGPFHFRRQPASLFARTFSHGWSLQEIALRASNAHPPADPEDPHPISMWAIEGEGRLWVQWAFSAGNQGFISQVPYFADDLEAIDEIERGLLNEQKGRGL